MDRPTRKYLIKNKPCFRPTRTRRKQITESSSFNSPIHYKRSCSIEQNRGNASNYFRRTQNWIGSPGSTINTATYIPPTPDYLMDCLANLEFFMHDQQIPPLIHIALCHYQFEAIHPFLDGNGRIGRLLISILLIDKKILPSPLLYLSAFFEATRDQYYKHLYNVSSKGIWREWLIYFLNGVAVQSEDVLSRAERINELLNQWKIVVASGSSQVPVDMIQHFAVNPYFT